ncbi:MAG: hypothetical protein O3B13_21965, partial [Planctomycetota bacterium]|nr:hypothetical protein [Planctomycetota bacterium]
MPFEDDKTRCRIDSGHRGSEALPGRSTRTRNLNSPALGPGLEILLRGERRRTIKQQFAPGSGRLAGDVAQLLHSTRLGEAIDRNAS